jgi:amino acid adenylation domain-containing protein
MHDELIDQWAKLVSDVLGTPQEQVVEAAATRSFVELGGSSLRGIELVARAETVLGRDVELAGLMGRQTLLDSISLSKQRLTPPAVSSQPVSGTSAVLAGQHGMLASSLIDEGTAFHLLYTGVFAEGLDAARLTQALRHLTDGHPALRTVFDRVDGAIKRRVLLSWEPVLIRQRLSTATHADAVRVLHDQLGQASGRYLAPFERPGIVFVLSDCAAGGSLLSMLVHHTIVDGWSIGTLWRDLLECYDRREGTPLAPNRVEVTAERFDQRLKEEAAVEHRAVERWGQITQADVPVSLTEAPTGPRPVQRAGACLPFGLTADAAANCEAIAEAVGVTRNTVLFAAWGLTLARYTGQSTFLIGLASASRHSAEMLATVGLLTKMLPVVCTIDDERTLREHVRRFGRAMTDAMSYDDVPLESLIKLRAAEQQATHRPLLGFTFAAQDELVPALVHGDRTTVELHEGFCGGVVFDGSLSVRAWSDHPVLALRYAVDAVRPDQAMSLIESFDAVLAAMSAPDLCCGEVRAVSCAQRAEILSWGESRQGASTAGLWDLIDGTARAHPDRPALRDHALSRVLTYTQLVQAAEAMSARMADAGVREHDRVMLELPRSVDSVVAVLAAVRMGACYIAVDREAPDDWLASIVAQARPRAVLCHESTADRAVWQGHTRVVVDKCGTPPTSVPPPAPSNPERAVYVMFTLDSTRLPKGVEVAARAVVELATGADYLAPGALERFPHIAPLACNASTLEVFCPLVAGGSVEVFEEEEVPSPAELSRFFDAHQVTGVWLTATLFRVMVEHYPRAFAGMRQVLTGGERLAGAQARRLLVAHPGLQITHCYTATENTTFATVENFVEAAEVDDEPSIGRPIRGTGVAVLDAAGRIVPPGATGELYIYGDGLASRYLREEQTQAAFGKLSADFAERLYRTGDVVRWDERGRLRFLGRRDRRVKVRGYRVELDAVAACLRRHPAVNDAFVLIIPDDRGGQNLTAAVVADAAGDLRSILPEWTAARLPMYAVPARWLILDSPPVNAAGQVDTATLTRLLAAQADSAAPPVADTRPVVADLEDVLTAVWQEVLDMDDILPGERFFDLGGDSLMLTVVRDRLRERLPGHALTVLDLFRYPTIQTLAEHLRARPSREGRLS